MSSQSPRPGTSSAVVLPSRIFGIVASVVMIATMVFIAWALITGPQAPLDRPEPAAAPASEALPVATVPFTPAAVPAAPPPTAAAGLYAGALATRDRLEQALTAEFGADLPRYAEIVRNPPPPTPVGGSVPVVESTHDTVFIEIPGPVLEKLLQHWGATVAVNTLVNGWREIYLPTPDNAARREQLARDIAAAMQRPVSIPVGTDRLLLGAAGR